MTSSPSSGTSAPLVLEVQHPCHGTLKLLKTSFMPKDPPPLHAHGPPPFMPMDPLHAHGPPPSSLPFSCPLLHAYVTLRRVCHYHMCYRPLQECSLLVPALLRMCAGPRAVLAPLSTAVEFVLSLIAYS